MRIELHDQRIWQLLPREAELEVVARGFQFTEGPVWYPQHETLIFSDIPADTMYLWRQGEGISIFRHPSHKANGNAYDRRGHLITCEHATSRVTRATPDGQLEVLASHFEGKALNSPNDVVVKSDGTMVFTDPPFGRINARVGLLRSQELDFAGVYRFDPDSRELTLLVDDFLRPNGLCFSLDERRLYVDDSAHNHIRVFDVGADGTLSHGRIWATLREDGVGGADGMKVDSAGNLYCTGPGGIHLFDPDAHYLGRIRMPEQTANLCFGDSDLRSLYVTASSTVYRLRVLIPGPPAAVGSLSRGQPMAKDIGGE